MMTNRLTVKVNYIMDAQKNGKFNFDIIIHKNFDNQMWGGGVKMGK